MRRIKLTLEYDGTDFKGWQVQSGERAGESTDASVRTVQGMVERALLRICGQPIRVAGASRTDAGVHARGQVASLLLPDEIQIPTAELCMALNSNMDKDVSAIHAEEAPLEFHAQRDALGKIYTYAFFNRRERSAGFRRDHWHVRFKLNVELMRAGAPYLVGTHDFTAFATRLNEIQPSALRKASACLPPCVKSGVLNSAKIFRAGIASSWKSKAADFSINKCELSPDRSSMSGARSDHRNGSLKRWPQKTDAKLDRPRRRGDYA